MSQRVVQEFFFSIFKVKLIWSKYDSVYYVYWTVDSSATKHGLMIHHHKSELYEQNWMTAFTFKVTSKGQNFNVCPDDIFQTTKRLVAKLHVVMHHHGLECHAKRSVRYFQGLVSLGTCRQEWSPFLFFMLTHCSWLQICFVKQVYSYWKCGNFVQTFPNYCEIIHWPIPSFCTNIHSCCSIYFLEFFFLFWNVSIYVLMIVDKMQQHYLPPLLVT